MLDPNDAPKPAWYDIPDIIECQECEAAMCDGKGFIPGTHEPCCYCRCHVSPDERKAMIGDMIYDRMKEEGK